MECEMKHGQALVITGPQGCGKSTLARKIAAQRGTFSVIDAHELRTRLGHTLASEPDTLIVDGFPTAEDTLAEIKAAIASGTMRRPRKHQETKVVRAPNFIFCSNDESAVQLAAQDRRFFVVRLDSSMR